MHPLEIQMVPKRASNYKLKVCKIEMSTPKIKMDPLELKIIQKKNAPETKAIV